MHSMKGSSSKKPVNDLAYASPLKNRSLSESEIISVRRRLSLEASKQGKKSSTEEYQARFHHLHHLLDDVEMSHTFPWWRKSPEPVGEHKCLTHVLTN